MAQDLSLVSPIPAQHGPLRTLLLGDWVHLPPSTVGATWEWPAVVQAWREIGSHVPHLVSAHLQKEKLNPAPDLQPWLWQTSGEHLTQEIKRFLYALFLLLVFMAKLTHSHYLKWKRLNNLKEYILLGLGLFLK